MGWCICPEKPDEPEEMEVCTDNGRPHIDDPANETDNNYWYESLDEDDNAICEYVEGGEEMGECECPE